MQPSCQHCDALEIVFLEKEIGAWGRADADEETPDEEANDVLVNPYVRGAFAEKPCERGNPVAGIYDLEKPCVGVTSCWRNVQLTCADPSAVTFGPSAASETTFVVILTETFWKRLASLRLVIEIVTLTLNCHCCYC